MSSPPSHRVHQARRVASWLIAIAILVWLFQQVPYGELSAALARVSLIHCLLLLCAYNLASWTADAGALWATLKYALPDAQISWGRVQVSRGAAFLLSMLNYGAGQAGIVYFLSGTERLPVSSVTGAILLTAGVNTVLMSLAVAVAMACGAVPQDQLLRLVVLGLAAGFVVYLSVIVWAPNFLSKRKFLKPLFQAGLRGHLMVSLARTPHFLVLICGHWAVMKLFGVHPSFTTAVALLPVVFTVGLIPISPSGLGTAQATAVALFAPYAAATTETAQQASVLAYSLSLHIGGLFFHAVCGLFCLAIVRR